MKIDIDNQHEIPFGLLRNL